MKRESVIPVLTLVVFGFLLAGGVFGYINDKMLADEHETWLHYDTGPGVTAEHVFDIRAGALDLDRHYSKMILSLDSGAGGTKWFNVSMSDGTNFMWINTTGATTEGNTTIGNFDLDVSDEDLEIVQYQSAGGAVSHVNMIILWNHEED